ncbi:MAG TPA: hypothetical protein VER32_11300 [Pyrinomonadaceae bacterium]|nr:hypothetical protein [Pyrinomonadaceae bacterium]
MQNFPTQPPAGGAPPAKKPGLSKGCLIGVIAAGVLVAVGLTVILAAVGGLYYFNRQQSSSGASDGYTTQTSSSSPSSSSPASDGAESPAPTSAQAAAVAGGQAAAWEQQEISWTVPQRWKRQESDSRTFHWRSPGSWEAASLIVNVSPMDASFPVDASIQGFYDAAQTRQTNGEVDEVRWLKLDGVRGVMFRESAPEDPDSPQRLQWMAYRNYKGQTQLVNIILASRGKDFARHEDALRGILYTTSLSR